MVLLIRDPQSLDELHMERLRKIFPSAGSRNLSALSAILAAQAYLANLGSMPEQIPLSEYARFAIRSNAVLNSLPIKTITTLGICLDNTTSAQGRQQALRRRAKKVEIALHVMVQKIMVVVCGRYDELLWKTLKCLVETVERPWW